MQIPSKHLQIYNHRDSKILESFSISILLSINTQKYKYSIQIPNLFFLTFFSLYMKTTNADYIQYFAFISPYIMQQIFLKRKFVCVWKKRNDIWLLLLYFFIFFRIWWYIFLFCSTFHFFVFLLKNVRKKITHKIAPIFLPKKRIHFFAKEWERVHFVFFLFFLKSMINKNNFYLISKFYVHQIWMSWWTLTIFWSSCKFFRSSCKIFFNTLYTLLQTQKITIPTILYFILIFFAQKIWLWMNPLFLRLKKKQNLEIFI